MKGVFAIFLVVIVAGAGFLGWMIYGKGAEQTVVTLDFESPATSTGGPASSGTQSDRRANGGFEVHVVAGGKVENGGKSVNVAVDRPGKRVVLILVCWDAITWNVAATKETTVEKVILGGAPNHVLRTSFSTQKGYRELPGASMRGYEGYQKLLDFVGTDLGADRLSSYVGKSTLPSSVVINAVNTTDARLLVNYTALEAAPATFTFTLNTETGTQDWKPTGPVGPGGKSVVFDPALELRYKGLVLTATNKSLVVERTGGGNRQEYPLPTKVSTYHRAVSLAVSSDDDMVLFFGLDDWGFIYYFDLANRKWLSWKSIDEARFRSLVYDPFEKQFAGIQTVETMYMTMAPGSMALHSTRIGKLLKERNNGPDGPLMIIPQKDYIVIVKIENKRRDSKRKVYGPVQRVWLAKRDFSRVWLTYKN